MDTFYQGSCGMTTVILTKKKQTKNKKTPQKPTIIIKLKTKTTWRFDSSLRCTRRLLTAPSNYDFEVRS